MPTLVWSRYARSLGRGNVQGEYSVVVASTDRLEDPKALILWMLRAGNRLADAKGQAKLASNLVTNLLLAESLDSGSSARKVERHLGMLLGSPALAGAVTHRLRHKSNLDERGDRDGRSLGRLLGGSGGVGRSGGVIIGGHVDIS